MTFPSLFLGHCWRPLRRLRPPRWMMILAYAGRDLIVDDGLLWASSIAFYGLLSLFPLVLAAVHIAAWFADARGVSRRAGEILDHVMPHAEAVRDIVDHALSAHQHTSLLSFLVLLYAGGRAFSVLIAGLNVASARDEAQGLFRRLLVELGMLLCLGLLFAGALLLNLLSATLDAGPTASPQTSALLLLPLARWVLPALLLTGGFFGLYKFVPRRRCNWQSALLGALSASGLCAGARPLFALYVDRLASYNQIYGWLTIGIILLLWAELLAIITLYGGQLASHVQMMGYEGLSGQEVSRWHRARALACRPAPSKRASPPKA